MYTICEKRYRRWKMDLRLFEKCAISARNIHKVCISLIIYHSKSKVRKTYIHKRLFYLFQCVDSSPKYEDVFMIHPVCRGEFNLWASRDNNHFWVFELNQTLKSSAWLNESMSVKQKTN